MSIMQNNPFKKPSLTEKRLKILIFGESGVGKTTTALQFPDPVVIDLDGGIANYGEHFKFDVLSKCESVDDVTDAIEWLATHEHQYKTLVIDTITIYWDLLQKKWADIFLNRKKTGKGFKYEFYEIGPGDWRIIKQEMKAFRRSLNLLDMNVVVIAREKKEYSDTQMMKVLGRTFDSERNEKYEFDTVVHMKRNRSGDRIGICLKDRNNKLPENAEFSCTYKYLEKAFGKDSLSRESVHIERISEEDADKIRKYLKELHRTEKKMEGWLYEQGISDKVVMIPKDNFEQIIEMLEKQVEKNKIKEVM